MNRGQSSLRALKYTLLAALGLFCMVGWAQAAASVYVDASMADDMGDGTSWATAKQTIQAGVDIVSDGGTVWVTNGTYNTGGAVTPGYVLTNRVMINKPITVRSVNGPEVTIIEGTEAAGGGRGADAIRGVYLNGGSTLIGFTVTNGWTMAGGSTYYNQSGGGVWMTTNCVASNLVVRGNGALNGGGVYFDKGGTLHSSTLSGNTASYGGGTYLLEGGTLNNCMLRANTANHAGGGAVLIQSGTLNNSTLLANTAINWGGGAYMLLGGTLNNSTLSGNSANNGGGAYFDNGGMLNNSIAWGNTSSSSGNDIGNNGNGHTIRHTCASDGVADGTDGNITADPLFVDAANNNFRLQALSPCINAGDNAYAPTNATPYDLAGNPRIMGGTVDMGAYEQQYVVSPENGPFAGGNTLTVTNGAFGTITNVLVGGEQATLGANDDNWFTITVPAGAGAGSVDIVVQTSDNGDMTLADAYTYNPAGEIRMVCDSDLQAAISAGGWHSLALKTDGSIIGWGRNDFGQANAPAGTNFVAVAAGLNHSLALKTDGSLVGWGWNVSGQASAPVGTDFVAVAAGGYHSLALKTDGSIIGWGQNGAGQINAPAGNDFVAVAAGESHSLALKTDGSIVGWGRNLDGEINVPAGNDFVAVAAGGFLSLALRTDGSIVGWGRNISGQTNAPAGNDFVAVAAGSLHSLALRTDGSLVGWGGNNGFGEINVPAGSDFVAVAAAAGGYHSLALKTDGSIIGWGDNGYGQTNVPAPNADFARSFGSGVAPSSGSWTGGYQVVISGRHLCDGSDITSVTLHGVPAAIVSQSATQVVVTVGQANVAGAGDVRVFSTSFGETVKADAFTYEGAGMSILGTNGAVIESSASFQLANGSQFAPALAGSTQTHTFSITNSGNDTLVLGTVSTSGVDTAYFEVSGVPASVAAGAVSTFSVAYTPGAVGSHTATVSFASNDPAAPYLLYLGGSCFAVSTNVGPFGGGNTITITNGNFGAITNVLVGGVAATIVDWDTDWVTVVMPAGAGAGSVDIVVQTSDNGDMTLADAYTYNPAGVIGRTDYGPFAWTNLRTGMNGGTVHALAHDGTNLYAGGTFTSADGVAAIRVAMWDASLGTYTNLDSGMNDAVLALAHDGANLYAGGFFTNAGGVAASRMAMWDASSGSWTNLGSGMNSAVWALAHDGANLYAGGTFTSAGGVAASLVSMWDASLGTWTNLSTGMSGDWNVVNALVHDGENLYAGGSFTNAGGVAANHVAMWDAAAGAWTNLGSGMNNTVRALVHDGTNLYAGGDFSTAGEVAANHVAMWDAVSGSWTNLSTGINGGNVHALAHDGENLYAGGWFTTAGGVAAIRMAMWDAYSGSWTNLGSGVNSDVWDLAHDGENLYAGGNFAIAGGLAASRLAKWGPSIIETAGVEPGSGSWTGGYEVLISGTNLSAGVVGDIEWITLAGTTASVQSVSGSTQLVVVAGASSSGLLGDVVVHSTSHGTTTKADAFTYIGPAMGVLGTNGAAIASSASFQLANGSQFAPALSGSTQTHTFSITNSGNDTLVLGTVSTNGLDATYFEVSGVPASVAVGAVSTFTVAYTPGAVGSHMATVSFASNDPASPYLLHLGGSCFAVSTNVGPFGGGNTITITNGNFGAITNVLVGGVTATIVDWDTDWVTVVMPAGASAGSVDIVVQTSDNGDMTLADAYTYNPAGTIGGMVVDGYVWTNMAMGFDGIVQSVYTDRDGVIYAGGAFSNAVDGVAAAGVARWDGMNWTNMGLGFSGGSVYQIARNQGGTLYAAGSFDRSPGSGSQDARRIVQWDGGSWTNVGRGVNSAVFTLTFDTNDVTYIAGAFNADGYGPQFGYVARWNGTAWTNIYNVPSATRLGFNSTVWASATGPDGMIYFAGSFTNAVTPTGTVAMARVARWDGQELHPMGDGFDGQVNALALDSQGTVYAGGSFSASGGQPVSRVAKWDGSNWTNLGAGAINNVFALAVDEEDRLHVGGSFSSPGNRIAVWDGVSWVDASGGGLDGTVYGVGLLTNRTMLAGGAFTSAGGVATNRIGQLEPNEVYDPGVTPNSGYWTGGYPVGILGENIGNGDITNVTLCGVSATILSQAVDRVWVQAGSTMTAGAGDVVVHSSSFGTTTGTNAFTYTASGIAITGPVFPPVVPGTILTNSFTVTNAGNEALIITAATNDGPGAAYFDVSALAGLTVAPGTASNFPVVFTASGIGSFIPVCYTVNNSPDANYSFGLSASVFQLSTNIGPFAGGNTITITNGNFGTVTNIRVGGVAATVVDSGANWFTIIVPAGASAGSVDIVVQTSDNGDITLANAYTYNPAGRIDLVSEDWSQWEEIAGLPVNSDGMVADVLNGDLYAVGGNAKSAVYRFTGNGWVAATSLPVSWSGGFGTTWNGAIYYMGGDTTNVYRFDGSAWSEVSGLPDNRMYGAAASHDGALYAAGGRKSGVAGFSTVYKYDGSSWTSVTDLPIRDYGQGLCSLNGELLNIGGYSPDIFSQTAAVYAYTGTTWSVRASLPLAANNIQATVLDGYAYVAGGYNSLSLTNAYRFDGTSWSAIPALPRPLSGVALATYNQQVYAIGGYDSGGKTNVYRYPVRSETSGVVPNSGSWTGGYEVVISGTNLSAGTLSDIEWVTLAGVTASVQSVSGSTQLVVTAGQANVAGVGDVRVYSTSYGETVKANGFTYEGAGMLVLGTNTAVAVTNGAVASAGAGTWFGPMLTNDTWVVRTLSITNSGTVALQIGGGSLTGAGALQFAVTNLPAAVGAGSVDTFDVLFDPSAEGTFEAALEIAHDSPLTASPYVVNLLGIVDETGPSFTNVVPTVGTDTNAANAQFLDLQVGVQDASWVSSMVMTTFRDYGEYHAEFTNGAWRVQLPLYHGPNEIDVVTVDELGNASTNRVPVPATDNLYNSMLRSGQVVTHIEFPDDLVPGTTVEVNWSVLSYVPVRGVLLAIARGEERWDYIRNGVYVTDVESDWSIPVRDSGRRKARIYSFTCQWPVPQKSGDISIGFMHAQMDGVLYLSAVIPDDADELGPGVRPAQNKMIKRTILPGETDVEPVSQAVFRDLSRAFEYLPDYFRRSGGSISKMTIPTNLVAGAQTSVSWSVISYVPVHAALRIVNVADDPPIIFTTNNTYGVLGQLTGRRQSSWGFIAGGLVRYAYEYDYAATFEVPLDAAGTNQIHFLNLDQNDPDAAWMNANIDAIDPYPYEYKGVHGRFIERVIE